jgi:hypothetical protein
MSAAPQIDTLGLEHDGKIRVTYNDMHVRSPNLDACSAAEVEVAELTFPTPLADSHPEDRAENQGRVQP